MAITNLGRVRFNMRGDYNPDADPLYSLFDLVSDGGGSFVYINDTPSNEPTSSTSHWQQIAAQGLKGDTGDVTPEAEAARDAAEGFKDAAAASALQLAGTTVPVFMQIEGGTTAFSTTVNGLASYTDGHSLLYYVKTTSTGDCTFQINALGAKNLYKADKTTRVSTGDLVIGNVYCIQYHSDIDAFALRDLTPIQKQYNTFFRKEGSDVAPNIINGHPGNAISSASWGCIISGGGNGGRENVIGGVEANVNTPNSNAVPLNNAIAAIYSRIVGGYDNVINGLSGTINADHCLIKEAATHAAINGGANHVIHAGDFNVIGGGSDNQNSSILATVAGGGHNVIQASSRGSVISGGEYNDAAGDYSCIPQGYYNKTNAAYTMADGKFGFSNIVGKHVTGGGRFAVDGDAQTGKIVCRKQTTNATQAYLGFDADFGVIAMPVDSAWLIDAKIIARRTDADNEYKAWRVTCMAVNDTGDSVVIIGTVKTVLAEMAPATDAWDVTFGVDVDSILPLVTGEAGKTINWVMSMETVEVIG